MRDHPTYKCPALKHAVALTSISDGTSFSSVTVCCPASNSSAGLSCENKTPEEKWYNNEVLVPLGSADDKHRLHSFDDIFINRRNWANKDGYLNEIVCEECTNNHAMFHQGNFSTWYAESRVVTDDESPKLVFLGPLLLESICNFTCYICGSANSTQWASAVEPYTRQLKDANLVESSSNDNHIDAWYNNKHLSLNKSYSERIREVLLNSDLSQVRDVRLVGGEPLYGKMFAWFMDLLSKRADLSEITLTFNTNISIFPSKDVLEILCKFKQVNIILSLDGIGKLQETIRPGVSWDTTDSNVKKWVELRNLTRNIDLQVNITLSILNVNKLDSILNYVLETELINIRYTNSRSIVEFLIASFVQDKPYLDSNLIPIDIREKWLLNEHSYNKEYLPLVQTLNNSLLVDREPSSTIDRTLKYLDIVQKITNTDFSSANPELYNCLVKLNKQNETQNR